MCADPPHHRFPRAKGLGVMGSRMAKNLLIKSKQPLLVHDVSPGAMKSLEVKGATAVHCVDELASRADIVITMLPAAQHVRKIMEENFLPKAKRNALLIDSSTIDPLISRELSKKARLHGLRMLDAPVSGGAAGAEAATLTFMCGGAEDDIAAAREVLQHMGKNIVHCGGPGTGGVAKICNNLVLGVNMLGVAEAMNLGLRHGVDPNMLNSIFNTSSARSWVTEIYNPVPLVCSGAPASQEYQGGFAVKLMQKDLSIASDIAKAGDAALPAGSLAHQIYTLMAAHGHAALDFSVVYDFLKGRRQAKG